jgi:hypothetical protein
MPFYRMGKGWVHLHMSKRARAKAPPPCPFNVMLLRHDERGNVVERKLARCGAITTHLCDWLGCNAPMCAQHAQELVPGFDFCPHHNARRGLLSRLLPPPETP